MFSYPLVRLMVLIFARSVDEHGPEPNGIGRAADYQTAPA